MIKNKLKIGASVFAISILTLGTVMYGHSSAVVPGVNEGLSVSTSGGSPNGVASATSVSQDGRFAAFVSNATNLVSSPSTSGSNQIYVRDRHTNTTELVSISITGTEANSWSSTPRISADGKFVVFHSAATNLVSVSTGGNNQVYVRNLDTNVTSLASATSTGAAANNSSLYGDVTADGSSVVFQSTASNLVAGVYPSVTQVFMKDMISGDVSLLSKSSSGVMGNGNSGDSRISCEGRYAVFLSQSSNLPGQSNAIAGVYAVDILKNSLTNITPNVPVGTSFGGVTISCNGNYIGFNTDANNIVASDTNGQVDSFIYDRINGSFDLLSASSTAALGNGSSGIPSISNDGRFAAFESSATNLIVSDTNGYSDVFLKDRLTGAIQLVTKDASGAQANHNSYISSVSSNAQYVVYGSQATNLVSGHSNANGAVFISETGVKGDY